MGITCGGIFGVLIAVYLVKSLPLAGLRWLVAGAVFYASASMLRAAYPRGAGQIPDLSTAPGN